MYPRDDSINLLTERDLLLAGADDVDFYMSAVRDAFFEHHSGHVIQPNKLYLRWNEENRMNLMPALHLSEQPILSVKLVTSIPSNPSSRGIPRGNTMLMLLSPEDGRPRALLAGSKISAMRTAAVTALAAQYFALPNANQLGILGAGPIAASHVQFLTRLFPSIETVKVFDVNIGRATRFCRSVSRSYGVNVVAAEDVVATVESSDIVVTATNSRASLLHGDMLRAGTFWSNVGVTEVDADAIAATDCVVVDDLQQCLKPHCPVTKALEMNALERSEIIELPTIVAGQRPGRTSPSQTVVLTPIGLGMVDAMCADRLLGRAQTMGLGKRFCLENEVYDEFGARHA